MNRIGSENGERSRNSGRSDIQRGFGKVLTDLAKRILDNGYHCSDARRDRTYRILRKTPGKVFRS